MAWTQAARDAAIEVAVASTAKRNAYLKEISAHYSRKAKNFAPSYIKKK